MSSRFAGRRGPCLPKLPALLPCSSVRASKVRMRCISFRALMRNHACVRSCVPLVSNKFRMRSCLLTSVHSRPRWLYAARVVRCVTSVRGYLVIWPWSSVVRHLHRGPSAARCMCQVRRRCWMTMAQIAAADKKVMQGFQLWDHGFATSETYH